MSPDSRLRGDCTLASEDVLRLIQVTDTHLMGSPGGRLLNVDTDDSLAAVIDLVSHLDFPPDAVLVTGDISGDGEASAYQRLDHALAAITAPSFWLPGNHDELQGATAFSERFVRTLSNAHWLILMLDTQQDGAVGGHLAPGELDALATAVDRANAEGKHLLVAMHHPVHPVGCDWLDPQKVTNGNAFEVEVQRCRQQVIVLAGHVHQASDTTVNGVRYLTSPSTCIQFAPQQSAFKVDTAAPGCRWLALAAGGGVTTGVERVTNRQFPVDLDSGGYM